jgi:hypothetical protein
MELGIENRCAGAVTAASRGLEPEGPPQFAVDLLDAKIPIEMGCQGRAL